MSAVLITKQNGAVDYVTDGNPDVVFIDFDELDPVKSFPEAFDVAIDKVMGLPASMPWRNGIIRQLHEAKAACRADLNSEGGHERHLQLVTLNGDEVDP